MAPKRAFFTVASQALARLTSGQCAWNDLTKAELRSEPHFELRAKKSASMCLQMKRQHHEVSSAKVITACNTVVYSKPSTMVNHPKFLQFLNQSLFLSHPKFGGWQLRHNPQHAGICLPSWRSRKVPSKDSRASLWSTHGRSCNRHWDWDWD